MGLKGPILVVKLSVDKVQDQCLMYLENNLD